MQCWVKFGWKEMNKLLIFGLTITALVACALAAFAVVSLTAAPQNTETPSGEFSFTVTNQSSCLRFLNTSVPVIYVPFTVAADQTGTLTVNCTQMPGGANGWTDVYIHRGLWDEGVDHICESGDMYPILVDVESAEFAVKLGQPYVASFGETEQQSYTVFFLVPPGGPSTFQVTYKTAN